MRRAGPHVAERRGRMLEHMARFRPAARPQPTARPGLSQPRDIALLHETIGYLVLFGIGAFVFQSRVPLYLGAFLLLNDGERLERAFAAIGIRFEAGAIGPRIVTAFASLFGWLALLSSLATFMPGWLASSMPPANTSWSLIAIAALLFAIVDAVATHAIGRAARWIGWEDRLRGLSWATIKLVLAIGVLALLIWLQAA